MSRLFFSEIEKSILKFIWKHKRLQIAKEIQNKKGNAGGLVIIGFKLYYRAIETKKAGTGIKTHIETKGLA
jgi:hypothetical protein